MDPAGANENLREVLQEKVELGRSLLRDLEAYKKVQGLAKLEKKIKQELKFLEKFEGTSFAGGLKKEHLLCSNLIHLACIVSQLTQVSSPAAVLQPFKFEDKEGRAKKVTVDIVCEEGRAWLKVVARNPRSLDLNSQGGQQYGQRSIMDQVKDYARAAGQNQLMFRSPGVRFVFASGVTRGLARRVTARGVAAVGEIVSLHEDGSEETDEEDDEDDDDASSSEESEEEEEDEVEENVVSDGACKEVDASRLNLDITAMIAYVSALTNGRDNFRFKEKILRQQADWERQRPVRPFLDNLFDGKTLVCCASAANDFRSIIDTLGGEGERQRAARLLERVVIVPDQVSPRLQQLSFSGKIKGRSLAIFGTGDSLKIVTVTANSGFIRAARGQGLNLAVICHESRALTEDKENMSVQLSAVED